MTLRRYQERIKEDPENYSNWKGSASNFDVHLNGNVAFVFYDEQSSITYEGEKRSASYRNIKYLEKKGGEWKLVAILPDI